MNSDEKESSTGCGEFIIFMCNSMSPFVNPFTSPSSSTKKDHNTCRTAITDIDDSCRILELKLKHFEEQILNNKRKAIGFGKHKKTKQKALYHLKIVKLYESKNETMLNIQLTLAMLKIEISSADTMATVVTTLDTGNKALTILTNKLDSMQVDDIMDSINDSVDQLKDINTIMSEGTTDAFDDKELEKELQELMTSSSLDLLPSIKDIKIKDNSHYQRGIFGGKKNTNNEGKGKKGKKKEGKMKYEALSG